MKLWTTQALLGSIALVLCLMPGSLPVQAAQCPVAFPATDAVRPPAAEDRAPCADALLAILFNRLAPAADSEIHILDTRVLRDAKGQDNAFIAFQIASPGRRRLCPNSSVAADMQVNFVRDPVDGWIDLDSRGSYDPRECGQWAYWSEQDIADIMQPPSFEALSLAQRAGVHDVGKGDPDRKVLLDAVRAANADLNDRIPIVFVVDLLRSDGKTAYFRGSVRRKADGRPLDAATWGQCEQDPETAVLEALLKKRDGRWQAVKANRCADDVFFTDAERSRYRLFLMED